MTADDPSLFEQFEPYMRSRLMIASAIIFRKSGWEKWTYGHEKLMGVTLHTGFLNDFLLNISK